MKNWHTTICIKKKGKRKMTEKRPNHRPQKERVLEAAALTNDYYTAKDVAELLNLSEGTIRRMIKLEELPAEKIGRQWIIRKADLEQFAEPK